jgi:hypothetical protein
MRAKVFVLAAIVAVAAVLSLVGLRAAWAANQTKAVDCCAAGLECCDPPQACCFVDCCAAGLECCDPPRPCCLSIAAAKTDCCAAGEECCVQGQACCAAKTAKSCCAKK